MRPLDVSLMSGLMIAGTARSRVTLRRSVSAVHGDRGCGARACRARGRHPAASGADFDVADDRAERAGAPPAQGLSFAELAIRPRSPADQRQPRRCRAEASAARRSPRTPVLLGHTITVGEPPNLPPWMPTARHRGHSRFHTELDGSSLALAGNIVIPRRCRPPCRGRLDLAGFARTPSARTDRARIERSMLTASVRA